VRNRLRVAVAILVGILESGVVIALWFAQDLRSWSEAPRYLRIAAPIPFLVGPPESGLAFFAAWTLNAACWGLFTLGILRVITAVWRRNAKTSAVA
jgi:hypothetical protein